MKPFQKLEHRGKEVLWATPDDGKLIELADLNPNSATLWVYHLYLEPDTELSEADDDGWRQIMPPSKLYGVYGERVREIDAPVPPWKKAASMIIENSN